MKDAVKQAFLRIREGFSADRIVADPDMNRRFLECCKAAGLSQAPRDLNRHLLNLRKEGKLTGIKSRATSFSNKDDYEFASEIAARFLERRDHVTLDDIICDPSLAREFDGYARSVSPGFESLHYRWAALGLRKRKRLRPEIVSRVAPHEDVSIHETVGLDVSTIPHSQGLYIFYDTTETLYVGETQDLQRRIAKHLEHSDNKGLARWLWAHGEKKLHLELHRLPKDTPARARRALEVELINSRRPVFNVKLR